MADRLLRTLPDPARVCDWSTEDFDLVESMTEREENR